MELSNKNFQVSKPNLEADVTELFMQWKNLMKFSKLDYTKPVSRSVLEQSALNKDEHEVAGRASNGCHPSPIF